MTDLLIEWAHNKPQCILALLIVLVSIPVAARPVQCPPSEHGDHSEFATPVALPSRTAGRIDPWSDVDYFRFEVSETREVTISTLGDLDTVGTLYRGGALGSDDDSGNGGNFSIRRSLSPGTYHIRVESFASSTGAYTLLLNAGEDDHGDARSSATRVMLPSEVEGRIERGSDVDYFRFEISAPREVIIGTSGGLDTRGTLEGKGSELASDDDGGSGGNFSIRRSLLEGTYYVRVESSASSTGAYTLRLTEVDDHGDARSSATPVALPSETAGWIVPGDDVDYFRFEVPNARWVTISTSGFLYAEGTLEDSEGRELASDDDSGSYDNFSIARSLSAGTYYVRVESQGWGTRPYTLRLADRDDHGGARSSATRVALPSDTLGQIEPGSDVDYFRFEVPEARRVIIGTSGGLDVVGTLENSEGRELASDDDGGYLGNFSIARSLSAGTYFVRVNSHRPRTGAYTLRLVDEVNGDDHGNVRSSATPVALPSVTEGWIVPGVSDVDYFRFEVSATRDVTISTSGDLDAVGTLEDSEGRELASGEDRYDGYSFGFSIWRNLQAGTYYVRVESNGGNGSYTLRLNEGKGGVHGDDHGDDRWSATPVALPSVTTGLFDDDGDFDYFRFEISGEARKVIIGTSGNSYAVGTLYDGQGEELESNDPVPDDYDGFSDINPNFSIRRSLSAGTYYVRVSAGICDVHMTCRYSSHYKLKLAAAGDDSEMETLVEIPDPGLRRALEERLDKAPGDPITRGEMAGLYQVSAKGVRQLEGIEFAVNARNIYVEDGAIMDLSPLRTMPYVRILKLDNNAISDLSPLACLAWVGNLYLRGNEIRDLSPLTNMMHLTRLFLDRNEISDVSPLARMTWLTALYFFQNEISDLSPLASVTSLRQLDLRENLVSDVSPLASLTSLEWLLLSGNSVTDLSSLAGLTSLTDLFLRANGISDVSSLGSLTSLSTLELSGNYITDVSPLASLTSLWSLRLNYNRISDVSALRKLHNLNSLSLAANSVSDVTPLRNLDSLQHLLLLDNDVQDVSPLLAIDGLVSVALDWNPLGRASLETHIPTLVERGVEVFYGPCPSSEAALRAGQGANCRNYWITELPTDIPDAELRRTIEKALYIRRARIIGGMNFNEVWEPEHLEGFAGLTSLDASNLGIEDLTGLEGAEHIRNLYLDGNKISDISHLADLVGLRVLTLTHNVVEDWRPLADMNLYFLALDGNSLHEVPPLPRGVQFLYLADNAISDIGSLANIGYFGELDISGNRITSIAPLAGQSHLRYLHVHDNRVADISSLNLASLRELHMRNNAVRDISPLLSGEELLMVDVRRNPLAEDALGVLEALRERRITVLAGETVPYFPAAGDVRQGFVRIVNRDDESGQAFIGAVDDAGVRAGPVRLDVGARQVVHFNSADLEFGNAVKGLSGIGPPTAGGWRLSVTSALDVEVLSYIRTDDGFVTAMHDMAADAMVPFFNPGSNRKQRSILRVVNTEAEPGKWTTGGYDDRGNWRAMAVQYATRGSRVWLPGSLLVRPQHALTLTAQALENHHGLGDGHGKWRLRVRGFPWYAMSLLESPTGHLTNLSTAPDNATELADGRTLHRLPLFPAAGGARQGFARVINRSYSPGEVMIEAVDDSGARSHPVRLTIRPRRVVHFNSMDLETGNAAKGLDGGVGAGQGDWRLEVTSELDLMVLSYARTPDGFLTSLHDLAPVAEDGGHRVVFFNPGGNQRQVSKLRLINDGDRAAQVSITGIDDGGSDSGTVTLAVPAGSAPTFTSAELEAGADERLTGRLGDGEGKWRLRVRSDEPIAVMSLLETPTGHLTNVSTGTAD